jgi:hypothetical protein
MIAVLWSTLLLLLADPPAIETRGRPAAMVADCKGRVEIRTPDGATVRAQVGNLVYPGERVSVAEDASAVLAILGIGAREELRPGHSATVNSGGCIPADAVARRQEHPKPVADTLKGLRAVPDNPRKAGVSFRSRSDQPPPIIPIFGATVAADRPALAWPAAKDATRYRVKLYSSAGRELWKAETRETRTAFPENREPLHRGYVFRWEVVDQDFRPVTRGEFSVATESELKQLELLKALAETGDRADRLAAALSYRRLGAYAEAIVVYENLAKQSSDEPVYRESLAELYWLSGRPKHPGD